MCVWLSSLDARRMLMMLVVDMAMRVFQAFVMVFVFVLLTEVQPDANAHQNRSSEEKRPDAFP